MYTLHLLTGSHKEGKGRQKGSCLWWGGGQLHVFFLVEGTKVLCRVKKFTQLVCRPHASLIMLVSTLLCNAYTHQSQNLHPSLLSNSCSNLVYYSNLLLTALCSWIDLLLLFFCSRLAHFYTAIAVSTADFSFSCVLLLWYYPSAQNILHLSFASLCIHVVLQNNTYRKAVTFLGPHVFTQAHRARSRIAEEVPYCIPT